MTSFIPGAPDYQLQQAPSTNLIGEFAYSSIADPVVIDLSAVILPHHQGLAFQYVIATGDPAGQVRIQTDIGAFQAILIPPCTLGNEQIGIRPVLGAAIVQGQTDTLKLEVTHVAGVNNQVGVIRVFGLTVLPTATEWNQPGQAMQVLSAQEINVGAGATVALLAAPPVGSMFKLKILTARSTAAPAANASMFFVGPTSGAILARFATTALNIQAYSFYPDLWWPEGVSFTNGSTAPFHADCVVEVWQLT